MYRVHLLYCMAVKETASDNSYFILSSCVEICAIYYLVGMDFRYLVKSVCIAQGHIVIVK